MALTRAKKIEESRRAHALSSQGATSAIVGTFSAMTASKDFELRKVIREAGGSYHVVKNKLAPIAAKGSRRSQARSAASRAFRPSPTPPATRSRSPRPFPPGSRTTAQFTFKLGIVDGKLIDVAEINNLATLPGKEELFSKLLFLINSPRNPHRHRHQRHRPQPCRRRRSGRAGRTSSPPVRARSAEPLLLERARAEAPAAGSAATRRGADPPQRQHPAQRTPKVPRRRRKPLPPRLRPKAQLSSLDTPQGAQSGRIGNPGRAGNRRSSSQRRNKSAPPS